VSDASRTYTPAPASNIVNPMFAFPSSVAYRSGECCLSRSGSCVEVHRHRAHRRVGLQQTTLRPAAEDAEAVILRLRCLQDRYEIFVPIHAQHLHVKCTRHATNVAPVEAAALAPACRNCAARCSAQDCKSSHAFPHGAVQGPCMLWRCGAHVVLKASRTTHSAHRARELSPAGAAHRMPRSPSAICYHYVSCTNVAFLCTGNPPACWDCVCRVHRPGQYGLDCPKTIHPRSDGTYRCLQ
jgi:hypothetical protein